MVTGITLSSHWIIFEHILWFIHVFSIFSASKGCSRRKRGESQVKIAPKYWGNPHLGVRIHHRCFAYCWNQTNTLQAFAFKSGIAFYMLSGSYRTNFEFRDLKSQISAIFGEKRPGVGKKALFRPKCTPRDHFQKFFWPKIFFAQNRILVYTNPRHFPKLAVDTMVWLQTPFRWL